MHPARKLSRSTPFRLAVTFTVLLVIAFVVSGFIVYRVMSGNISERLDETVGQAHRFLAATFDSNDEEDLVAAVDSRIAFSEERQFVAALADPKGVFIAGNIRPKNVVLGFSTVAGSDLGLTDEDQFRLYSAAVGPYVLTIGTSYSEADELRTIVLVGFGWATVIVAILAISVGVLLAARVERRLDTIAKTMVDVSHGKLASRIPLIGKGDDIDDVSAQINAALDRLSALVEGMRQVSADIAHELKTPLNRLYIILGNAASKASGTEIAVDMDEARGEMEQINATFDALLRIAQIEAGARKAKFKRVDLGDVLATIAEIYGEVAADDGKSLAFHREESWPTVIVQGDADLLTQMFANLVENALRHCPPGTAITLSATRADGRVSAEVRDNGPGIPAEERDKVFRRLYRMDNSRSTPGSGLGLSLVSAIADLHGATIELLDGHPGVRVVVAFPTAATA